VGEILYLKPVLEVIKAIKTAMNDPFLRTKNYDLKNNRKGD
jgi:hypothetical protein